MLVRALCRSEAALCITRRMWGAGRLHCSTGVVVFAWLHMLLRCTAGMHVPCRKLGQQLFCTNLGTGAGSQAVPALSDAAQKQARRS